MIRRIVDIIKEIHQTFLDGEKSVDRMLSHGILESFMELLIRRTIPSNDETRGAMRERTQHFMTTVKSLTKETFEKGLMTRLPYPPVPVTDISNSVSNSDTSDSTESSDFLNAFVRDFDEYLTEDDAKKKDFFKLLVEKKWQSKEDIRAGLIDPFYGSIIMKCVKPGQEEAFRQKTLGTLEYHDDDKKQVTNFQGTRAAVDPGGDDTVQTDFIPAAAAAATKGSISHDDYSAMDAFISSQQGISVRNVQGLCALARQHKWTSIQDLQAAVDTPHYWRKMQRFIKFHHKKQFKNAIEASLNTPPLDATKDEGKPRALGGDVTETSHDMTEFDHSQKDDQDDDGRIHECDERK